MEHVATFKAIIAVGNDCGLILAAPQEAMEAFDGVFCEDNSFEGVPQTTGLYLCTVEFHFSQGYFEGYRNDGENDWKHVVTKSLPIMPKMPDVTHSWASVTRPEAQP